MANTKSPLENLERLNMAHTKRVLIIGAGGYIGSNLKHKLLLEEHDVYYTTSSKTTKSGKSFHFDILDPNYESLETSLNTNPSPFDIVYIVAWPLLDKYFDERHISTILPNMIQLHDILVNKCNIKNIVYAGTCYEYGLIEGSLPESITCLPISEYGKAKLALCQYVTSQSQTDSINVKWIRIFYPYGKNQRETSLIPSLIKAIDTKQDVFKMSKGDQVRDFIHIDKLIDLFISIGLNANCESGIYNCGSGNPVRLIDFLRDFIKNYNHSDNYSIKLDTSAYPYRKDEPFAFWADMTKTNQLLQDRILE